MGAVTTTFIAGVHAVNQGLGASHWFAYTTRHRPPWKTNRRPHAAYQGFRPFSPSSSLTFGTWDIYEDNAYEAAIRAKVLESSFLEQLKEPLSAIRPMKAVFDHEYVTPHRWSQREVRLLQDAPCRSADRGYPGFQEAQQL